MISALQAENEGLRTLLEAGTSQLTTPPKESRTSRPAAVGGVSAHSPEVAKIALFRSLFRGRDDVFAYRWEGREGKSGYSPG